MSSHPLVTIVLIGYNDEARIGRALASIQRQTLHDIEIVVVDDASTDGTAAVVESCQDPRVRYTRLKQNSGGCSAPRNHGLALARSPYVMFCDSDDELVPQAAALLWEASQRSASDVTCGLAERIDVRTGEVKLWRADLHASEYTVDALGDAPDLLYDTISVNKMYRTEFLRAHAIDFPEGLLFEDQLFTLKVFLAAQRICVVPHVVYRWYVDQGAEELSITQGRSQRRNIEDRLEINRRMDQLLEGKPELAAAKSTKFLRHEGYLYLGTALSMADPAQILDPLRSYLETVPTDAFFQVRPMLRIALYEVLQGNVNAACAAMRFEKWASVLDGQVVMGADSRTLFIPRGHEAADDVRDLPQDTWLDASSLVLHGVPWSQRRYLHRIDHDGTVVTMDYLPSDPLTEQSALCVLADGSGRARAVRSMERASGNGRITWKPTTAWQSAGPPLTRSQRGTVQMWITRDGVVNRSIIRSDEQAMQYTLEWHPHAEWDGPTSISLQVGARGAVQWVPQGHARSLPAGLRTVRRRSKNSAKTSPPARALVELVKEIPEDRMIITVVPAASPVRREWPLTLPEWASARWYLLLGGQDSPSVPTATRGFARDVRDLDLATLVDLAELVITDDPHVLDLARIAGVTVIRYRPDLGAGRYTLPPVNDCLTHEHDLRQQVEVLLGDWE